MPQLTLTSLPGIPMVKPGDSLNEIIDASLAQAGISLMDGDILVLAQKVVSKSEGRLVNLTKVTPSVKAEELASLVNKDPRFVELVLRESSEVLRCRPGTLIVQHRLGFVCANAGIDHSNVEGLWGDAEDWILLLPENPDQSAERIREYFQEKHAVKIGVLIIDSHGRAWRNGIVGTSIGFAGMPGVVDMRGAPDLLGYQLRVTTIGVADELAAGASLLMGQAAEGRPVVHVRGFPYPLCDGHIHEMIRPKDLDLFR